MTANVTSQIHAAKKCEYGRKSNPQNPPRLPSPAAGVAVGGTDRLQLFTAGSYFWDGSGAAKLS